MTLQVALVGKDGVVIASDRKATRGGDPSYSRRFSMRQTADVRKILVSENGDLVCAFSGDQIISDIARRLTKSLNGTLGSDIEKCLRDESEALFNGYDQRVRPFGPQSLIIALSAKESPRLWEICFYGQPVLTPSTNRLFGGDKGNSAVFFAERYYGATVDKAVEELKLLAAHTILEGGFLNSTWVGGLDMIVWKNGEKARFLSDDELQSLCDRSKALHESLARAIFPETTLS